MSGYQWRLRTSLIGLLAIISSVTFLVVGAVLFLVRIPQITAETRADLRLEATDLAQRSTVMLGALQTQLELIAAVISGAPAADVQLALERAVGENNAFTAVYQIDRDGTALRAAVSPALGAGRRQELIGSDLSRDPLFGRTHASQKPVWGDKYLSPVSSVLAIGIGVRVPVVDGVIIGEVPLDYILRTLRAASGRRNLTVWVVDRHGEILADSENSSRVGVVNLAHESLLRQASTAAATSAPMRFEGRDFEAAAARSPLLGWSFVTRTPGGIVNPRVASAIELGIATVAGSMLLGLALAPFWAMGMARPISAITERARQVADGQPPGAWPRGRTIELNELSADLERMATTLQERQQELEAIFDASPVGIDVLDPAQDYALIKRNDASMGLFRASGNPAPGAPGPNLTPWCDRIERRAFYATLERDGFARGEAWLRQTDGRQFLAALTAQTFFSRGGARAVVVSQDITEMRRIEAEVRALNAELEARVQRRTEQLHCANAELSSTVERLRLTQNELVRSEKLAALGALVAGVAHELNTPLGNSVMAVSTLRNALGAFHREKEQGLKRSSLDRLLEAMETGTDIAARNLARAAELVASFKQVAVDQTSAQRRVFTLDEVCNEIVLTLRPLLTRGEVAVTLDVPPGLRLDSYPGALGQVLTNLIDNAVTHAFGDRREARVCIAAAENGEHVTIRVRDNGGGIPPELLSRIFDPFVTTRMGSGGSGLGLHITYNLVAQALGGSIEVDSAVGVGTTFTISLPRVAPAAVNTSCD